MESHTLSKVLTDVKDILRRISEKLDRVIQDSCPLPLHPFIVSVPYTRESVVVDFKNSVKIPLLIGFNFAVLGSPDLPEQGFEFTFAEFTAKKMRLDFSYNMLSSIRYKLTHEFGISGKHTIIGSKDIVGSISYPYLTDPEFREALKEGSVKSRGGLADEWFVKFIEALDHTAQQSLDPRNVFRNQGIPPVLTINLFDVTNKIKWMKIEYGFFLESGTKKKGLMIDGYVKTRDSEEWFFITYLGTLKISPSTAIDITTEALQAVSESDKLYSELKKHLRTYVDAYAKTVVALKMINSLKTI